MIGIKESLTSLYRPIRSFRCDVSPVFCCPKRHDEPADARKLSEAKSQKPKTTGDVLELVEFVLRGWTCSPMSFVTWKTTGSCKKPDDAFQANLSAWILVFVKVGLGVPFVVLKEPVDLTMGSPGDPWECVTWHSGVLVNP